MRSREEEDQKSSGGISRNPSAALPRVVFRDITHKDKQTDFASATRNPGPLLKE